MEVVQALLAAGADVEAMTDVRSHRPNGPTRQLPPDQTMPLLGTAWMRPAEALIEATPPFSS